MPTPYTSSFDVRAKFLPNDVPSVQFSGVVFDGLRRRKVFCCCLYRPKNSTHSLSIMKRSKLHSIHPLFTIIFLISFHVLFKALAT